MFLENLHVPGFVHYLNWQSVGLYVPWHWKCGHHFTEETEAQGQTQGHQLVNSRGKI